MEKIRLLKLKHKHSKTIKTKINKIEQHKIESSMLNHHLHQLHRLLMLLQGHHQLHFRQTNNNNNKMETPLTIQAFFQTDP